MIFDSGLLFGPPCRYEAQAQ